jgi:EAL domain-containing protein (putative c-di-GMP-specific phosphodiesterase class I)
VLRNLRESGVQISIDDFGQGYSSFTYLKNFPASELKIDQSFVTTMGSDARSRQLVKAIIDLAHDLDMRVVAEGVEDQVVLDHLIALGCDMAQGYHLARPLAKEELLKLLHE